MAEKKKTAAKHKRDFEHMEDSKVLEVVLADYQASKSFQSPYFEKFREYYQLYRSFLVSKRPSGSNLFIPYTFSIIETIAPKIINAMFYTRPYVQTVPLGVGSEERTEKAKRMNELLDYQFMQKMSIAAKCTDTIKTALMYGTAITKQTWDYEKKEVIKRQPREFMGIKIKSLLQEVVVEEVTKDFPKLTLIPILDFYFDPAGTTIDDCRYNIHRYTEDIDELKKQSSKAEGIYKNLDKLEGEEGAANIGESDFLSSIGFGDNTKSHKEIEILEYWTDDWVVKVANQNVVIMSQANPFFHKKKPFAKWVDTPVPNEFYGIGEIEPITYLQHELNTTRNQRIDNASFALNRMWKKIRGSSISAADLVSRPNGVIEVDDMSDLQELEVHTVTVGHEEEQTIKTDIDRTTGVYDSARGSAPSRRETATTMSILSNASSERFQVKVLLISEGGFKDAVRQIIQLNQQYIDHSMELLIRGQDGTQTITNLEPADILGEYDILAVGSAIEPALNKEVKQNQFIQLLNVINQNPLVNQQEFLKRLFEAFEMKNIDALLAQQQPMMPGMEGEQMPPDLMSILSGGGAVPQEGVEELGY